MAWSGKIARVSRSSRRTSAKCSRRPVLAVLAAEAGDPQRPAGLLAQVAEVLLAVGDRHQQAARAQHPADLREAAAEVGHVVQHPQRCDDVEGGVVEGQVLDVADPGGHAAARGEVDQALGPVEGHDVGIGQRLHQPGRELAGAAADLEHPARAARPRPRSAPRSRGAARRRWAATPTGGGRGRLRWRPARAPRSDRPSPSSRQSRPVIVSTSRAASSCSSVRSPRSR